MDGTGKKTPLSCDRGAVSSLSGLCLVGVLAAVRYACGMVVLSVLYAEILENIEYSLAVMTEYHCTVMRIALLDEYIAVESAHFLDAEDSNGTEGAGSNGKDLALCSIGAQCSACCGLETEECDIAGLDVALECTSCDIGLLVGLEASVHDELILHNRALEDASRTVAAVEAHEGILLSIIELAFDIFLIDVAGNGVVDVKESYDIIGYALADVFAENAVDINFTGYRDALCAESAVYIAGNEAELSLEGRPALVSKCNECSFALVCLCPVKEGELILCESGEYTCHLVAVAEFLGHILDNAGDTGIILVLVVSCEQVELGVLLDLYAEIIKSCDRSVAGKEVLGTGAEADYLEVLEAYDSAGNRNELMDHISYFGSCAYGIFGDISLDAPELEVVACVEHSAVSIASVVNESVAAVILSSRNEHCRAVEVFSEERFGSFGTEVAEIYDDSVAACSLYICESLSHIQFVFDNYGTFVKSICTVLFCIRLNDSFPAVLGKSHGEAVTGNCYNAYLELGNIL